MITQSQLLTTLITTAHNAMSEARSTLAELIAGNDAAQVDSAGRFALDGLSERARRMIQLLDRDAATDLPDVGIWTENGRAPLIRAMVRESERLREMASINQHGRIAA